MEGDDTLRVATPVLDLLDAPDGARIRQLLWGAPVRVLAETGDHARVQAVADRYEGFARVDQISTGQDGAALHVTAAATHVYRSDDIKSGDVMTLSFGSRISVLEETGAFIRTGLGFIPRQHVGQFPLSGDIAAIAETLIHTPYLWGGNSRFGVDCSGLVQLACHALGIACPGDSSPQQAHFCALLGTADRVARNCLIFWPGHVAIGYGDRCIIHANGHHMSTVIEDAETAFDRIRRQGHGEPLITGVVNAS